MAKRECTANLDVHALPDGGFRSSFEIVGRDGAVVQSGEDGAHHATASKALAHARSLADAAMAVIAESIPVV
ncbi:MULTISPECIES: hypothetical protein [Luteibacter]|uniref:hypothetical protein n=1 Tax=Luteibacter TaxID=242605 RepID=UPI00055D2111|nr:MULTISPECIES: hypothetical protein [unclassified Luteibacter]